MKSHKSFSRSERVSEQIRRVLADLIGTELKDPRVGMVSITAVEVTPDYSHAKVYFSTLAGHEGAPVVMAGLDKAAGFLRRELGKRITLHTLPQLHFVFDESLERGADLTRLIHEAVEISKASESSDPSAEN